jgi:hypothetical protein
VNARQAARTGRAPARQGRRKRRALFLLACAGLLLLGACQPLYFPLVPEIRRPEPRLELEPELLVSEGRPQLQLFVREVPFSGWLAIQWFSPANVEVASDSVWLDEGVRGQRLEVSLPRDVAVRSGEWRALLSQAGVVLRQLSVELP